MNILSHTKKKRNDANTLHAVILILFLYRNVEYNECLAFMRSDYYLTISDYCCLTRKVKHIRAPSKPKRT